LHAISEVFFCQEGIPVEGSALTMDQEPLFWFQFPGNPSWIPALPNLFPPLPPNIEPPDHIQADSQLCHHLLLFLGSVATKKIPEARAIPVVQVFPVQPLVLGRASVLVCLVDNIFPPVLDVTWQLGGVPVTQGVTHTPYTPTPDLTFSRSSYLRVTPAPGDNFACVVTHPGDNTSTIGYWVAPSVPGTSVPLVTLLCGAVTSLGVILGLLGVAM
ncbi:Class II histocompatibility antigen, M alpha chain, partial [Calypte anna]